MKRQISKLPLQTSMLVGTNKSLKTIKAEILLTFVSELFDDYYKLKNNLCDKQGVISIETNIQDDIVIDTSINELASYLKGNVISKEELVKIFSDAYKDEKGMLFAKQYEPLGVYYEKLASLLKNYIPIGALFIPEYFGLLLISYYKASGYSFSKFDFINNYNMDNLLDIYQTINIIIKKEMISEGKRLWECRTTIDQMEKVAQKLIKEYNTFQYKINIIRKSKTRGKK